MKASKPIGIFDSGVGGLSVWTQLSRQIPGESIIYLADSAHAPYGNKSKNHIIERSRIITRFFIEQDVKLVVVACNTATGAAISLLRQEFAIPFVGVEPAIKPAALDSRTGHIGVLATEQTFKGEHFKRTFRLYAHSVQVHVQAGNGLVELIENGRIDTPETRTLLTGYLNPMVEKGIDQLVLGCTHYPFLIPLIRQIVPETVRIIDPAPAVARQTHKILESSGTLNSDPSTRAYTFYTTGFKEQLSMMVEKHAGNYPVIPIHLP